MRYFARLLAALVVVLAAAIAPPAAAQNGNGNGGANGGGGGGGCGDCVDCDCNQTEPPAVCGCGAGFGGEAPKYKCLGTTQPHLPPYCNGTWPFGIACFTCREGENGNGNGGTAALHPRSLTPDGSLKQMLDHRAVLASQPSWGYPAAKGAVFAFSPCAQGGVTARAYTVVAARRIRQESARILL